MATQINHRIGETDYVIVVTHAGDNFSSTWTCECRATGSDGGFFASEASAIEQAMSGLLWHHRAAHTDRHAA
jgi:hypothetical protein